MLLTTATRNSQVTNLGALLNGGSIKVFAAGDVLLATHSLGNPALASVANGIGTFGAIGDDVSADATGTASYFIALNSGSTEVYRGSVGTSGAELNFDSISFIAGGTVKITGFTITQPAS